MNVLILGANSDMAKATARLFAEQDGADITLASRDVDQLEKQATDLNVRYGVTARAVAFDALDRDGHQAFYAGLDPKPDVVVLAFGTMGPQELAQSDPAELERVLAVNYLGAATILEACATDFETRGAGVIVGISSVAGLRGRMTNYAYGAAKAALTAHLSGLRHRLYKSGAHVVTVLPGFVDTKMTEGMDLPAPLTASPEEVARAIRKAVQKKRNTIYVKWMWRYIMWIIRFLPEFVFKRTKL